MKSNLLLRFQIVFAVCLIGINVFVKAGKISVTNCDDVCGMAPPPPDLLKGKYTQMIFGKVFYYVKFSDLKLEITKRTGLKAMSRRCRPQCGYFMDDLNFCKH